MPIPGYLTMHYFKRNIGDYHKKAGRLSMLEHGAYTLLIDSCYDREKFPTRDEAMDWCWARTTSEIAAVEFVLSKFFDLVDGRYVQNRIREEIEEYNKKALQNKEIAIARENARKLKREQDEHESCTDRHLTNNQKPLTNNQKPVINNVPSEREHVPVDDLIKLFNSSFETIPEVKIINDKRRAAVRKRWLENKNMQNLERWKAFFDYIKQSDFLMGRTVKPWSGLCFDWIFAPANFAKIIEGNYHGDRAQ